MRHFHSYGPVNCKAHFCVERRELIEACTEQLIGSPDEVGGHYFTIWAPRQTGKTWLMQQSKKEIESRHSDQFIVATMSMQGVIMKDDDQDETFFAKVPRLILEAFKLKIEAPRDWESFTGLFLRDEGPFDRPVILFIDEFDSLPRSVIDRMVTLFRDMYLKRDNYLLHGLALIGVRAGLGVESDRGSPFNVQRSLHVPNFSEDEVVDLFRQYQEESDQKVEPEVVAEVYRVTCGQPGLVCWFGELLTEKYNPGGNQVIHIAAWKDVYRSALSRELNNTVLNLVKKARGNYQVQVMELFAKSDIPFTLDADWCNYLYLNGIIDVETITSKKGVKTDICRLSSPFVQERLYKALTTDLIGDHMPIPALDLLDDLADVFREDALDLPALLERYKAYLERLMIKGINPWKEQLRRSDLHLREAVGHFHLYAWLQAAVGRRCVISPEFPTGNGKVDLLLRCGNKQGIIEVKSFVDLHELEWSQQQAAGYAASLGMDYVVIALFVPSKDKKVLQKLSSESNIEGVRVTIVAIGWDREGE